MEFVEGLALSDRIGAALESAVPIPEPEIWRIVVRLYSQRPVCVVLFHARCAHSSSIRNPS